MPKNAKRLSPPALPGQVLERPDVDNAIDTAATKDVIFICAPAGFGKTLAMSLWLRKRNNPAAWIPLTVYDDSPSIFCRYLLRALVTLDGGAATAARAALDAPGFDAAPFEYFFEALSSMPEDCGGGIIVLDDFHLIENENIQKALPLMIRKLSPAFKVAILSRVSPPATFSDLALKDRIGEVTEQKLRFTRRQIIGLYKEYGIELSAGDALEAETKTEGWALGIAAQLLSLKETGQNHFGQASGERYIDHYLKSEIWDKWDGGMQEFLLRTSILEDLQPELCDRLCGCDSEKILSKLMSDSGLIVRLSDGSFRYHHILRDFLRQMAKERQIELSQLYIMAAQYMYRAGRFSAALDYYVKSGDYEALSDFVIRTTDYNSTRISTEEYLLSFKNLVLNNLSAEILERQSAFIPICAYTYWMIGNVEQMNLWFSKARELLSTTCDNQTAGTMLSILYLDPYINPWEFVNKRVGSNMMLKAVPSIFLTVNLPFFHRGLRDYSEYMEDWEVLLEKLRLYFVPIFGINCSVIMDGVQSGIYYEQNKLTKAKEYALIALGYLTEESNPELFFIVYMHIIAVLFAEGDDKGAWEIIGKAQSLVKSCALFLRKNLDAMVTKYRLYKGDKKAAGEWLSSYGTNGPNEIHLYHVFQGTTTVRAQISTGDFSSALLLLSSIEKLTHNCRRPLDRLEVLILRSIILWRQRQRTQAVDTLREAVLLAWPCGYVRMFTNEGAAVLPILQKLYNAAVAQLEEDGLLSFIRELIFSASETAKTSPGIVSGLEEKPLRLSRQQQLMLNLLSSGMNNRQICEEAGLKLNTVKAHLFKLYEKLDVHNATDAVLKARRLNLLQRSE